MFIFIIIMVILSTVTLFSLRFTLKKLHIMEIFAYWMFICAIVQQVFTIITMNLGMIVITEGVGVFWYLIMIRLILIPSIIIWLFYFSKNINLAHKAFLAGICIVALSGIQLLNKTYSMITYSNWNIAYSFAEWFTIILISFSFFLWFRYLLKKEDFIV